MKTVSIEHSRFQRVQPEIFVRRVVTDCMSHECKLVEPTAGPSASDKTKLDACCQYGVDVDVGERDGILLHREEIAAILTPEARDKPWFIGEEIEDADFANGRYVRTNRHQYSHGEGCVFLSHDGRGCAVHRAAIEGGWSFSGIKPHVCRLFPLTYTGDLICLSDDHPDYSCAYDEAAPTVYRGARDDLAEFFGEALIVALDACEQVVLAAHAAAQPTRLPLASG